jgi:hypothetical protein
MHSKSRLFLARTVAVLSVLGTLCLFSTPAAAYIGPGAGLSAIGTALALIATVCLAIVGFLWYPAKRLSRRLFGKAGQPAARTDNDHAEDSTSARPPA